MDVSVIIVNYNTVDLTANCLRSVYNKTVDLDFEVIVVDNASSDGSIEMIRNEFPYVKLIVNHENLGFGRANNLGIKIAKGKYVFLLNSDTLLINNAVKLFFDWMEINNINNTIGAIGCILQDANNEITHSFAKFPTITRVLFERLKFILGIQHHITKIKKKCHKTNAPPQLNKDYITGADLFIPLDVLKSVGAFDEVYFMYFEEADLQLRMYLNGYKMVIIEGPKIIHYEGKSFNMSSFKRLTFDKSSIFYVRKHGNKYLYYLFMVVFTILLLLELVLKTVSFKNRLSENINAVYKTIRCG